MKSEIVKYLNPITNAISNIAGIIQTASRKPGYDTFREDFQAITHEVERIGKAVHCIEHIEGGKVPPYTPSI